MDQELIAYLDKRFNEVNERIQANSIEIEGLRSQIQQVAEGVAANNENLESFRTEAVKQFDEMRQLFNTSHSNLHRRVSSLEAWREKVDQRPAR